MTTDPRLANIELLTLAAMRLQRRQEVAPPAPHWRDTVGLSALLDAAKALPRRAPWDLPSVEDGGGLARLLEEARAREQARP